MSRLPYSGRTEGKHTDGGVTQISNPHHHRPPHHHHHSLPNSLAPIAVKELQIPDGLTASPFTQCSSSGSGGEMAGILAWFWNERFWLPHNVTWADLKNTDEATFPQAEDLYLACPLAFCIFMLRLVFERWVPESSTAHNPGGCVVCPVRLCVCIILHGGDPAALGRLTAVI